jgi:hypothetical protein
MDYCVEAALPYICNPKALKFASYALVALVHFLALWTHHVFVWNSRFNCTCSACPEISLLRMITECAVLEVLLVMLLISYWRCILTSAGSHTPSYDEPLLPNPSHLSHTHTVVNVQPAPADVRGPSVLEGRNRSCGGAVTSALAAAAAINYCSFCHPLITFAAGVAPYGAANATKRSLLARTTAACATRASCAWTTTAPGSLAASAFATTSIF